SCHYVDRIGYREFPHFIESENYLKTAEMQLEDDYGMIDGVINNGPKEPVQQPEKSKDDKTKKPSFDYSGCYGFFRAVVYYPVYHPIIIFQLHLSGFEIV